MESGLRRCALRLVASKSPSIFSVVEYQEDAAAFPVARSAGNDIPGDIRDAPREANGNGETFAST